MRRVNFLANAYRLEPVRNDKVAGVCDPGGEMPANCHHPNFQNSCR